MEDLESYREFLKDRVRLRIDFRRTPQNRRLPPPPPEKPAPPDAALVDLPPFESWRDRIGTIALVDAIARRESRRRFAPEPLSLDELAFLLWATQGVRETVGDVATLRTVPSAGARHSFETYLFVFNVRELEPALYRYLPLSHRLARLRTMQSMRSRLTEACLGQRFAAGGAVTFVWTTIPYRMEWRYSLAAHRVILIDAGHVCQNLYLACEALNAGTCAIAAYDQDALDALLGVDGKDEFAVYLAPVGKRPDG